MGFQTIASYVDAIAANGQNWLSSFTKVTNAAAYVAGSWYDLSMTTGNPRVNVYPGGLLTATRLWYKSAGNIWHGANVSPLTKHLTTVHVETVSATVVPSTLCLLDYIMFYPLIDCDSSDYQEFDQAITLPRYTDGRGLRAFIVVTSDIGAVPQTIRMKYTNSAGTGDRWSPNVALTPSAIANQIAHSGIIANNFAPFIPLMGNDAGILSVQGVQLSDGTGGGWACLVICKPLISVPLTTVSVPAERDCFTMKTCLPRIQDQAFLNWLILAGAAVPGGSTIRGRIEVAWN